jgi:hypothetical protein
MTTVAALLSTAIRGKDFEAPTNPAVSDVTQVSGVTLYDVAASGDISYYSSDDKPIGLRWRGRSRWQDHICQDGGLGVFPTFAATETDPGTTVTFLPTPITFTGMDFAEL